MSEKPIKIAVTTKVEGEIHRQDLGRVLIGIAADLAGGIDDAGCDWCTRVGHTFIGNDPDWHVSSNPNVAALVDAGNVLIYGAILRLEAAHG